MSHVPHVYVENPWDGDFISLSSSQWHHLIRVLRLGEGERVGYSDGRGLVGSGVLNERSIRRGEERQVPRPSELILAVAPPGNRDRTRFLVEKLAELGIAKLVWIETRYGSNRVPSAEKLASWAVAGLEQSQGAWLMETGSGLVGWSELKAPVVVCEPEGSTTRPHARTVVVGPEGGFAEEEVPEEVQRWGLGPTILRVETAAVVAAARLLS